MTEEVKVKVKKTDEERLKELEQKINRLQSEKQRLKAKKLNEDRKKRDHAMIVVGTTVMTHFEDMKDIVINSDDESIKKWVHSLFEKEEKTETE